MWDSSTTWRGSYACEGRQQVGKLNGGQPVRGSATTVTGHQRDCHANAHGEEAQNFTGLGPTGRRGVLRGDGGKESKLAGEVPLSHRLGATERTGTKE